MSEAKYQYFCTKCGTTRDSLLDHPAIGIGGYSWNCPRCNGPVDSREIVVSEAPKKIWFDPEECSAGPVQFYDDEIPYIREDLVDALVAALEELVDLIDNDYEMDSLTTQPSRAALAKLEESHD